MKRRRKKNLIFLLLAIFAFLGGALFLFFNESFKNEPTDKFLSLINIQEDGSIKVRELIKLNGDYNGFFRNIEARNDNARSITGTLKDIRGNSKLYDGDKVIDVKVGSISDDGELTYDDFNRDINYFNLVDSARNGDNYKYTLYEGLYGKVELELFNSSDLEEIFYLEYTITDVIVVHNDIAELAFNVLGDGYEENIEDFSVKVVLPNDDNDYQVWLHGPLNGNINKINNREALGTINKLNANEAVSVRMIFSKDLVPNVSNANKKSGLNAKDEIIEYQNDLLEQIEEDRQEANRPVVLVTIIAIIYIFVAFAFAIIIYLKYKRPTYSKIQYIRDIPFHYDPSTLEYLLDKDITEKSLVATIISLINKKVLKVEKIPNKDNDYKLIFQMREGIVLRETEKLALDFLIKLADNSSELFLSTIKDKCKDEKKAESFMESYSNFKIKCSLLGELENFYTKRPPIVLVNIIFLLTGIPLAYFLINMKLIALFIIVVLIIIVFVPIIMSYEFYTPKGKDHYLKWMALKRFLDDFSNFSEKELPDINVFEEYLVYATILGNADKLNKAMKLKVAYPKDEYYISSFYLYEGISNISSYLYSAMDEVISSINSTVSTSSSGYSGSSGGGGSFGGGGGGGRF